MESKIYVGSGKGKFNNDLIEISVCLTDLPKDFITEYKGKEYINLKVQKKKEIDQFGKSHFVEVNTWKPENKIEKMPEPKANEYANEPNDLPF